MPIEDSFLVLAENKPIPKPISATPLNPFTPE